MLSYLIKLCFREQLPRFSVTSTDQVKPVPFVFIYNLVLLAAELKEIGPILIKDVEVAV